MKNVLKTMRDYKRIEDRAYKLLDFIAEKLSSGKTKKSFCVKGIEEVKNNMRICFKEYGRYGAEWHDLIDIPIEIFENSTYGDLEKVIVTYKERKVKENKERKEGLKAKFGEKEQTEYERLKKKYGR